MSYDLQKYVISKALISKQEVARELLSAIPATVFTDEHFQIIAAGIIEVGTDRNTLVKHTGIDFEEIDELSNMNAPDFPMKTNLKTLIKDLLNFDTPQEPESHVQLVQDATGEAHGFELIEDHGEKGETTASDADPLTAAVDRLAKLSPLQYDRIRKDEAKTLGVRPGTLDAAIKGARKEDANDSPFEDVDPWHEPVDGAELLTTLATTIRRFIICEPHTANAAALWITMAWFIDVIMVAALAVITAPEKRCGKSLLLFLIGRLVPRPLMSSSITPSALFRSIDAWQPTLLIDEVDACLKDNEELRGLINCGHTRDSAFTIRCVGDDHTPKKFNVWGAKALAGIGHVADTLMDRSIILELRRKLSHESVDRIRHAEPGLFNELCAKLARFADDNTERVRLARPDLPPSLNDRAQDNWEPLLAIATVAGGDWFNIATAAALKLSGGESLSLSIGTELLADIQEIFEYKQVDRISTAELIKELCNDDEKPWTSYNRGLPIKPRQIAAKLKGYGIQSRNIRLSFGETPKGYLLEQFKETFIRYLSATQADVSATLTHDILKTVADNPPCGGYENETATLKPASIGACGVVADRNPLFENEVIDLTGIDFEVAK